MASRTSLRSRLLAFATGVGVAVGLLGATAAQAEQYQVGELEIYFDTTVSAGAALRTASTESSFLPQGNGGREDTRPILNGGLCDSATFAATSGTVCDQIDLYFIYGGVAGDATVDVPDTNFRDNFDGSVNTDDGRLNWDQGDFIGATAKVSHDLQINWRNFTLFTRAYYFYDAVLNDAGAAARSPLSDDTRNDIGHNFDVLDAYISADFDLAGGSIPINVRHGWQVINWGEGTFILNGVNVVNPIDVNAFRRPGSEIREALLPVHATYAQVGLPYNLSLEAFYQWEWDPYQVDPQGSPYSNGDIIGPYDTSAIGNVGGGSFIGGSQTSGTYRRNCDASALYADSAVFGAAAAPGGPLYNAPLGVLNQIGLATGAFAGPDATLSPGNCNGSEIDMRYEIPIGMNEEVRLRNGDLNYITRGPDQDPDDGGQYGFALRYYADWLNATEFGAYFVNYHSRVPFVAVQPARNREAQVFISTVTPESSALTRQVLPVGCVTDASLGLAGLPTTGDGFIQTGHFPLYSLTPVPGVGTYEDALATYIIGASQDPNGYMDAVAPIADAILASAGTPGFTGTELQAAPNTYLKMMQINCALAAVQSGTVDFSFNPGAVGGLDQFAPTMVTGAEILGFSTQHDVFLQYPEDIRMFGISFNTTIGTWGVQGEFTYRDNQPLQLDTDMLTITSGLQQCGFGAIAGDLGLIFEAQAVASTAGTASCNPVQQITGRAAPIDSYVREEVFTGQVGTTATYTASNPIIGALGADLGILVTEAGFVYVPDVPDEGDFSVMQLAGNGCQGNDLPLSGVLALDVRSGCRPTDFSWGYVLLGRLDYNNVMGAFTVSPTFSFSHNVEGYTPAPLGNYLEDRMSASFSIGTSYQNTWRTSLGYTSYFGGGIRNKQRDQDFASVSVSYSF